MQHFKDEDILESIDKIQFYTKGLKRKVTTLTYFANQHAEYRSYNRTVQAGSA
jgi:hypothetical protein